MAMLIIVDVLFTPRDLVSHMSDVAIDPFLISERKEARAKGQGPRPRHWLTLTVSGAQSDTAVQTRASVAGTFCL